MKAEAKTASAKVRTFVDTTAPPQTRFSAALQEVNTAGRGFVAGNFKSGGSQRGMKTMEPRPFVVLREAPPSPTLPTTLRFSFMNSNSPICVKPFINEKRKVVGKVGDGGA